MKANWLVIGAYQIAPMFVLFMDIDYFFFYV
jgi:hypothetical protein